MRVLVINSGSSSIKFRLYEMEQDVLLVSGTLERIGEANGSSVYREYSAAGDVEEHKQNSPVADHAAGLIQIFAFLQSSGGSIDSLNSLHANGHRVVHGGQTFQAPTLIDEGVIDGIRDMVPLAPLHNPANLAGIEATRRLCPQVPQVAVFDTAFFRTLPPHAYRYALPDELYRLKRNLSGASRTFDISREDSKVKVLVIPAKEELEIARQTVSTINQTGRA